MSSKESAVSSKASKKRVATIASPEESLSLTALQYQKEKRRFEKLVQPLGADDTPKLNAIYAQDHITQSILLQWAKINQLSQQTIKKTQSKISKFFRFATGKNHELCIVHYQVANKQLAILAAKKKKLFKQLAKRLDVLKLLESNDEHELKKAYQHSKLRFNRTLESLAFTFISLGNFLTLENIKLFSADIQEIIETFILLLQAPNLKLDNSSVTALQSSLLSQIGIQRNWLGYYTNREPASLNEAELRHLLESLSPIPESCPKTVKEYKSAILAIESSIVQMPNSRLQLINDILTAEKAGLYLNNEANKVSDKISATTKGLRLQIKSSSTKIIDFKSKYYSSHYYLEELNEFEEQLIRLSQQHNDIESRFSALIADTKQQTDPYEKHKLLVQHCELRKVKLDLLNQKLTASYEKYQGTISKVDKFYTNNIINFKEELTQALNEMLLAQQSSKLVEPIAHQEIDKFIRLLNAIINHTTEKQPKLSKLDKDFQAYMRKIKLQINTVRDKLKSAFELNIDLIDGRYLFGQPSKEFTDLEYLFTTFNQLAKSLPTSLDFDLSHALYIKHLSPHNPYRNALNSQLVTLKESYLMAKEYAFEINDLCGNEFSQWQVDSKPFIKRVDRARREIFYSTNKAIIAEKKIQSPSFQTSLAIIDNIDQEIKRLLNKYLPQKQTYWQNQYNRDKDCQQTDLIHQLFSELTEENTLETIELLVKEPPAFFLAGDEEVNPLSERYQNLFQDSDDSRQREEKLLDLIDPRLKRLISLKSEFSQVNSAYLGHRNRWSENDYHRYLTNKVQDHLNNDHMEDLSEEKRLRLTQWIRCHVYKPLQKGFQNISLFFSPLPENQQKPCFVTWQATKTEREMVTLGNDMINNLNAAAPAA